MTHILRRKALARVGVEKIPETFQPTLSESERMAPTGRSWREGRSRERGRDKNNFGMFTKHLERV